jgi:LmbE family N-acetylglucosaminyl deacetylase
MPLTVWLAGSIALVATVVLIGGLWFDRLFEARSAERASSLVQHLGSRSVLAVFAHPDDETLAAGALADAAEREGIEVRTITLTKGERGYAEPPIARREDLRLVRESELRRFGFALGIDHQELWDYPDGELGNTPGVEIVERLVERIRTWRPDLVLTFDPAGGYNGHPDHKVAGAVASDAVRAGLDPEYRPELGAPHRPRHLVYVLAPARALQTIGGSALRVVARVQPDANLAIRVRPEPRILGWQTHVSQHLDRAYPLPGWLLFDFWDKEHYRVLDAGVMPRR